MVSSFFLLLLLIIIYIYLSRNNNYWKNKGVPYFTPTPLFGTIYPVLAGKKSISEYLHEVYKITNLSCAGFFIFDKPALLARDPELIKTILMTDFNHFQDRNIADNKEYDKLSGVSLLMLKSSEWVEARSRFTSTLALGKVKSMLPLIIQAAEGFADYVKSVCVFEETTECRELAIKYSIDVLASYAFGLQVNSFQNSDFYKMSRNLQNVTLSRVVQSICYFFAHWFVKPFRMTFLEPKSVQFLTEVFRSNIEERRRMKQPRVDLVESFIKMDGKTPNFILDYHGLAISLEYMTAGFVSSATTLSFCMYDLCINAKCQERVREEIRSALDEHGELSFDAVNGMIYLDMCIKESLRMHPILGFLDRCCTKTFKIPNTDITIDKGVPVYISLYGLHNDPQYFPEPEKYNPDRFSPENRVGIDPFTYLPFGEGRRNCIGSVFGYLIVKMALIKLLLNFEIVPCNRTPSNIVLESSGFITVPQHEEINVNFKRLAD